MVGANNALLCGVRAPAVTASNQSRGRGSPGCAAAACMRYTSLHPALVSTRTDIRAIVSMVSGECAFRKRDDSWNCVAIALTIICSR